MVVVLVVLVVGLLVVATAIAPWRLWVLDREVARRHGHPTARRSARHGSSPAPDVSVEEIALLTGGRRRVAETGVARLVEAGALAVDPDRSLHPTGLAGGGDLDRAVVDASSVTGLRPTADVLVSRVRRGREVDAVVDGAHRRGLVHDAATMARVRRDSALALGGVALLALVVAGVLGGSTGATVGVVGLVGALLGGAVGVPLRGGARPTGRGRATVAAAAGPFSWAPEPAFGAVARPTSVSGAGVVTSAAALVAAGGLARFPDPEVADLLVPPPSSSAGGGGYVGGDGGGGGCGGGDGGGGGGGC